MNYALARWQDPETGRFMTVDPARSGINWYAYCGNNPMGWMDPTGLDPDDSSYGGHFGWSYGNYISATDPTAGGDGGGGGYSGYFGGNYNNYLNATAEDSGYSEGEWADGYGGDNSDDGGPTWDDHIQALACFWTAHMWEMRGYSWKTDGSGNGYWDNVYDDPAAIICEKYSRVASLMWNAVQEEAAYDWAPGPDEMYGHEEDPISANELSAILGTDGPILGEGGAYGIAGVNTLNPGRMDESEDSAKSLLSGDGPELILTVDRGNQIMYVTSILDGSVNTYWIKVTTAVDANTKDSRIMQDTSRLQISNNTHPTQFPNGVALINGLTTLGSPYGGTNEVLTTNAQQYLEKINPSNNQPLGIFVLDTGYDIHITPWGYTNGCIGIPYTLNDDASKNFALSEINNIIGIYNNVTANGGFALITCH